MTTNVGYLSPVFGAGQQAFDNQGNVLSGGKIWTYDAGTTTPTLTYTDSTTGTPNSNPIVLLSSGRSATEIWLLGYKTYKFVLTDSNNNVLGTWDNIYGLNANSGFRLEEQTATQGQTVFTLTNTYAPDSNSLIVYTNGKKESITLDYAETSSAKVTFTSGKSLGDVIDFYTGIGVQGDPTYEEYTAASTACTGAITTACIWKLTKSGNKITLTLPAVQGNGVATTNFTVGLTIPSRFRPAADFASVCAPVINNGANQSAPGAIKVTSAGVISVWLNGTFSGNFTITANAGLAYTTSVSWTI